MTATTQYLKISALQEPFDSGIDDNNRATVTFNVLCEKVPSDTFARELVSVLVAAGVGTFGTSLFSSTKAVLPITGTIVNVIETSGMSPKRTHNKLLPAYQRPTAKIIAHAVNFEDAMAKAKASYKALLAVRNQAVTVA